MKGYRILAALAVACATQAAWAQCASTDTDEAVKNCLAQDLRDSDKRINAVYKLLMGSLDDAGKANLREQQRAWLKTRDKACDLDNKETNREKWLQAILADQKKTICVVRHTFTRVGELDQMAKQSAPGAAPDAPAAPSALNWNGNRTAKPGALPASLVFQEDGYKAVTANSHERGKWYMEVWIDRPHIAGMGDLLITPGYFSRKAGAVRMINVRHTQSGMEPIVLGLALDLDGGFFYVHQDGFWKVLPGLSGGVVMPMNTSYVGGIDASSEVRALVQRGLVKVNVGERPFEYAPPQGYRAWGEN